MTTFHVLAFFVLMLSPAVGIVLAVLVDHLPRGGGATPVWLKRCVWRGRCASCGAVLPAWVVYTVILAVGAAVMAVIASDGRAMDLLLGALFLWLLITLAVTDWIWMRLPDLLTALLAFVAFAMAVQPGGLGIAALWGALIGSGSFAVLRWVYARARGREGLGLGDVKLMAGLGAAVGPLMLPWLLLLAAALALLGAVIVTRGRLTGQLAVPFGTALCLAGACVWLWPG